MTPAGHSATDRLLSAGTAGRASTNARKGQYKLLDFNPRLGAQFRLFRNQDGLDVVLAAYLDLTGQAVPEGTQPERPPLPRGELEPARRAPLLAGRRTAARFLAADHYPGGSATTIGLVVAAVIVFGIMFRVMRARKR